MQLHVTGLNRDSYFERSRRALLARKQRPVWSAEEDRVLRELKGDLTQIAVMLPGRSRRACQTRIHRLGIGQKRVPWTAREIALLRANRGDMTKRELATLIGRSWDSVKSQLFTRGWKARSGLYGYGGRRKAFV